MKSATRMQMKLVEKMIKNNKKGFFCSHDQRDGFTMISVFQAQPLVHIENLCLPHGNKIEWKWKRKDLHND
jgi:hypothetical protein